MAGTNDFLPFATSADANVLTQAEYAALTALIANGFQTGTAQSVAVNKVLRQASIIGAVIGQLVADATGQNAADDGTTASLIGNLARAIRGDLIYAVDTGTAGAYAITLSPAPIALVPGMLVQIDDFVASNTGASTLNVNGLGTLPIQSAGGVALQGGELVAAYGALLRLNHAGTAWTLLQTTGGALPVMGATQTEHAVNLGQICTPPNRSNHRVTSSRAIGTVYTNTTGRPLLVQIEISTEATAGSGCRFLINGGEVSCFYTPANLSIYGMLTGVVPPLQTYELTNAVGTNILDIWTEY